MSGAPVETAKAELIAPASLEVRQSPAWNKGNKYLAETSKRLKNYSFALLCVLNLSALGVLFGVASWFGPAGTPLFFAIVVSSSYANIALSSGKVTDLVNVGLLVFAFKLLKYCNIVEVQPFVVV